MKSLTHVALAITLLALAACSGSGRLRYETPEEAYRKGFERYEKGDYDRAAEYFRGAFDFGRTHEFAADAQLFLARSHARSGDYLLAANEYNRFIQLYRRDPRVASAQYEYAMTYYERSPGYQLDQSPTENAIEQFQLFIDRYPTNELVADAEARINELREKLALKRFESAGLYERRGLHEAAALTYESVFDEYPGTRWADDALAGAFENYVAFADQSIVARKSERLDKAIQNYDRLREIFADSPHVSRLARQY
ncbi:MAG: outer membrane protein assembly factor BamD, partial [Rhodothermales bacterium]|nr:outer membrane protein assembly factor BamD [Rhodothermales bacterium]